MAKEKHLGPTVIDRLSAWQRKLRMVSSLIPVGKLPLLTPAQPFGPDVARFRDSAQALVPWRDKQSQWWTFTGHLNTARGRPYAFQLAFLDRHTQNDFVGAVPARWLKPRIFSASFSITDPMNGDQKKTFRYWQRGGLLSPQTGFAAEDRFHLELSGWHAYQRREDGAFILFANGNGESLHLELRPTKPLAYHGQFGYSQKDPNPDNSSFYCSYTRMHAKGWILADGKLEDVSGDAWMDHEKLTSLCELHAARSDWVSLQFDGGEELMLYLVKDFSFGSWIDLAGSVRHLIGSDIQNEIVEKWISPKTDARYAVKRRLVIEPLGLDLNVRATVPNQEVDTMRTNLHTAWQGAVSAQGRMGIGEVRAQGFMELTGYDQRPRAKVLEFLVGP